ncbi:MAG: hypothetical protein H6Q68_718 [Firmicutes bacterium]|nr:hypothetical protein [Bacillota bacterium]
MDTEMHKNQCINQNIKEFVKNYNQNKLIPREDTFKPEIIIPCYNHGQYLQYTLKSLPKDIAVTIVNDASTDNTAELIADLQHSYKFKLLTNQVNVNQVGSLNRAITESSSNLFIILNADDALIKYAVNTIIRVFTLNQSVRMVGGDSIHFTENHILEHNINLPEHLSYEPKPSFFHPADALNYHSLSDINMTMSGCSFLRSAWEAVNGFWAFDKRVCSYDDRDFQMRVSALFDVAVLNEPLAFYRTNSSQGKACI